MNIKRNQRCQSFWTVGTFGAALLTFGCGSPELAEAAQQLIENAGHGGDPIPVEPCNGIGDGAGPPGEDTAPEPCDEGGDGPMPVEPGGGIGDGAGPIPVEPGDGPGLPIPEPIPEGAVVCGGFSGNTCTDDEYCAYMGDFCGAADATSICRTRPTVCDDEEDGPVCACDGNTYPSACEAAAAGFGYAQTGACE